MFIAADGQTQPMWVADSLDERMANSGWLADQLASRALDVPVSRVRFLGSINEIRTERFHGRTYYWQADVEEIACGRSASEARDALHVSRYGAAMGLTSMDSPEPARSDPGMDFLKKFGGG
jgi:hypothetical protein